VHNRGLINRTDLIRAWYVFVQDVNSSVLSNPPHKKKILKIIISNPIALECQQFPFVHTQSVGQNTSIVLNYIKYML